MAKKSNTTIDRIQAIWNMIGGDEGADALISGRFKMTITATKHTIDFAKLPKLSFKGAKVTKHEGKGRVIIELRSDDNLYIDGKKVVLYLSEHQKGKNTISGHRLRKELEKQGQILLNSNVLDYLFDHPELFPEHWKEDEKGEIRCIFFWGSILRHPSDGSLYVRYFYWEAGNLYQNEKFLGNGWDCQCPAVTLES
jgi:hypothetical protein